MRSIRRPHFPISVKTLEHRRIKDDKIQYKNPKNLKLKSKIRRRRVICEHIEELSQIQPPQAAIQSLKEVMQENKWSLNKLVDWIDKKKHSAADLPDTTADRD